MWTVQILMIDKMKKAKKKWIAGGVVIYVVYAVAGVTGGVYLSSVPSVSEVPQPVSTDERVALVETGEEAWQIRRELITEADTTLDIATFAMQGGETVDLFYSLILEAADRGVQVRLLLDGIFHGMRLLDRQIYDVFLSHPNIEVGMYDTLNPLRPWTWNNRMHDKLLIADEKVGLIGGRNVGDKYFNESADTVSYDRELLVIGQDGSANELVSDMSHYFDELWSMPYVTRRQDPVPTLTSNWRVRRTSETLRERAARYHEGSLTPMTEEYWMKKSHAIDSGYFVHNGLERLNKEPAVWHSLLTVLSETEESILIQSPYVIPDAFMSETAGMHAIKSDTVTILTNGLQSTPNIIAHSGYRNHRDELIESGLNLLEFQKPDRSLHMKSFVKDNEWVGVGSFNIDARSTYLHTESMLVVSSPSLAEEINRMNEERYGSHIYPAQSEDPLPEGADGTHMLKQLIIDTLRPLTDLFDSLL